VTAGVAAPLTIIAAGIAVAFLATTAAEFTRAEPAAGRFITYMETGLGPRAGRGDGTAGHGGLHLSVC
jgi:amino acid transporter